jgi:PHD/YefM family antitoxin component YafN of YafNO toxin-antitoxin module
MKSTNPKTLRAEMRTYLDLAANEPLRILRRSGQAYILINEKRFSDMHDEIVSLQRRLIALANTNNGAPAQCAPAQTLSTERRG